ncbi:MAG TPA: hypothetical protein GXZ74_08880 [Tissierellia bacterium]|nr:hypothetical protein [Tissierellia bacterium]
MKQIVSLTLRLLLLIGPVVSFADDAEVIGQADGPTGIFTERASFLGLSLTTWIIILVVVLLLVALRAVRLRDRR